MTESVIYDLEMIEVDDEHSNGVLARPQYLPHSISFDQKRAPIGDSRERVDQGGDLVTEFRPLLGHRQKNEGCRDAEQQGLETEYHEPDTFKSIDRQLPRQQVDQRGAQQE